MFVACILSCMVIFYGCNNSSNEKSSIEEEGLEVDMNENGNHECVDLGLSVKWATCNIGADKPEDYGYFFAWGEITPKDVYSKDNYSYNVNPQTLPTEVDAATANWGKEWRTPTEVEFKELLDNCDWKWTGDGCKVTGLNGNSIFFPAAGFRIDNGHNSAGVYGCYWSVLLCSDELNYAMGLNFYSDDNNMDSALRCYGLSVRAVCQ